MNEIENSIYEKMNRHRLPDGTLDEQAVTAELSEAEKEHLTITGLTSIAEQIQAEDAAR